MRKTIYQKLTKSIIKNWPKEKNKEWRKNASFWLKIIRENLDPFRLFVTNKAVLDRIKEEKNLKILDAGCGEGYFSRLLAKKGHEIYGIDACSPLIKAARNWEKEKPLGIKYFQMDFRKTNFPKAFFDLIISHQTIHEIPNPEKAFQEFYRILKKGGRLILLFLHPCFEINPQPENYFQKTKIKRAYYLVSGIKSPSAYFYLHLPLSKWIDLLTKNGFLIKNLKEPHPSFKLLKKDKWWQKNFSKPLFILIEAIKL